MSDQEPHQYLSHNYWCHADARNLPMEFNTKASPFISKVIAIGRALDQGQINNDQAFARLQLAERKAGLNALTVRTASGGISMQGHIKAVNAELEKAPADYNPNASVAQAAAANALHEKAAGFLIEVFELRAHRNSEIVLSRRDKRASIDAFQVPAVRNSIPTIPYPDGIRGDETLVPARA